MKTIIALLILTMFILGGCATQKACCPPKDVIFYVYGYQGVILIEMEKDFFNKDKEGKEWMDAKKFYESMKKKEPMKNELKKQSNDAVKETDKEVEFNIDKLRAQLIEQIKANHLAFEKEYRKEIKELYH